MLCSRNAGCTSRPHKDGIQGKGLQSTLGESIKPLGNGGRCCSKEVFDTRRWDEAHKLKECHCKQMKNLYSQSSFIAKVIKKDPKRNDTRPHGMSYHEKGVVSDILRTSRMDDSDTKNDCIVLYEDLQQIPQMSSGRVRIEVIYSKEQIKRSQNTAQVGEGCSGRVLYMDDVSYVSPSLHEDAQRCQSSTVTGLHGIADKDDLREFFRRPMKPVLDKAIHESRRNCRSTHSLCQSKKLANFIPHITASRVSESASLIILNPEALKNISFTRFWPPSTRNWTQKAAIFLPSVL